MGPKGLNAEAVTMLLIAVAINLAFFYGMATRPVIFYHLSTSIGYNETIDFSSKDLRVDFIVDNGGASSARLWLIVAYYNMSLTSHEGLSVQENEASVLRLPLSAQAHQSSNLSATFNTEKEADYMILILSVEGNSEADPLTRFFNSFAIINPERPTAILLKNLGDGIFMRVRSR